MPYLSTPIAEIKPTYTAVVIGSGYGGAIAASRLARAGQRVCILERGREFQPGDYPDTLIDAGAEMQIDAPPAHLGSRTGLYDFRVNHEINVFLGCGLGGTSLVNANVSIRAEPRVFADPRWPEPLRRDLDKGVETGYQRAVEMLKPATYPVDQPPLPKLQAQERSAAHLDEPFQRLAINVNFDVDGPNHVGVPQKPCTLCGDCVTGCNHGAKNTVLMNYLPDAKNHGAEIFTQVSVRRVERRDSRWVVHYQILESGREAFDAPTLFVSADIVVLAAGSLGSTEILLRSRAAGLAVSGELGRHFTGNGDVLGFAYNCQDEIRGVGYGPRPPDTMDPVGPCITGVIDARGKEPLENGMVIEEGSIPGALGDLIPGTLAILAAASGVHARTNLAHAVQAQQRLLQSLGGAYHGAARNTQIYLVMTHDDGDGRLSLEHDRLRIHWPGVGTQPIFGKVDERLRAATAALGGTFVRNPIWTALTSHDLVTVHPLGGSVMADEAERGVVNHKGQVFSGSSGTQVYDSLYVSDGAVIPRSLGVNPLLTISALAERCCAMMAQDRGWIIDYRLPSAARAEVAARRTGIQFTETMRGTIEREAPPGKGEPSPFEFTLTVISDDLVRMLAEPNHTASMVGTVVAPGLSPHPLTVTNGEFNLFVVDPTQVDVRRMRYRMTLTSKEGKTFWFEGFKVIRDDPGPDLWRDTTTLYIVVHEGLDAAAPVYGRGVLHILPVDFLRQMTTMRVRHAANPLERLKATAAFGRAFAGALFDIYGDVVAPATPLDPAAPPRERRGLRMDAPTTFAFQTDDNVSLRLTRYQGGPKGPVILAPGFGTSGMAYTIDTTETNFPEYLYAHGYDVWVFDYRASPALPASRTQFTVDDIATRDWPAAVRKVRQETGRESVQVVGHCVGSMSFLMAGLAGLQGVRSAVCSQLTTHPVAPFLTDVKAATRLGDLLYLSGVHFMTTEVDWNRWQDQLFDNAMRVYPSREGCRNPVCRRVLFMYGEVYKHDLLNVATHDAIHEMFGRANFTTLKHITTMIRKGHVVDKDGHDVYLPNIRRLSMPIAFIHGAENRMFLPKGSELAYQLLCRENGERNYVRHVIPGYGHMDCFIGRDAVRDVFPVITQELEKWNQA